MTAKIDHSALASALLAALGATRTKEITAPSGVMGHGVGGLFSQPGLETPLVSAMILPQQGILNMLPLLPTITQNPLYGIITGVTDTSGANPANSCESWPVAGTTKLCMQSSVLGCFGRSTTVIDLTEVGQIADRADFLDNQVLGSPFTNQAMPMVPTMPGNVSGNAWARDEVAKRLAELMTAVSRDFAPTLYKGNPANNDGKYAEFRGFDKLINTGYQDAVTGVACAAADSIIQSFGNLDVATNGANLVELLSYVWRNLNHLAAEAQLNPVSWAIAMPYNLFYELTAIWPCSYLTARCSPESGSTNFVDAKDQTDMRDSMRGNLLLRTGQYLLIDGVQIPVVLDDAITEDGVGAGTQQSSIYFIPMTVLGGRRVTYLEYINFTRANADARALAPTGTISISDDGRFLWLHSIKGACVRAEVMFKTRLVLRTPYLAARITHIRYTPRIMPRSPFPDSPYFVNGGSTTQGGPSYYPPTA